MKLTAHQIEEVRRQTGGLPVADSSAEFEELKKAFGDDSYYAASTGIIVWEWKDDHLAPVRDAIAIQLAEWHDRKAFTFVGHEPRRTKALVRLPMSADGSSASRRP